MRLTTILHRVEKYKSFVYGAGEFETVGQGEDRFHIMQHFGKALDEIRAEESIQLQRDGYEPVLKKSRWCLLKRRENLTESQTVKLSEVLKHNLRSVRAYLHREEFQRFWEYTSGTWAGKFLDEWTARVMRSRLEPLKKVARMLRSHRELVRGERDDVVGRGGGPQQQGESGDEKIVRVSHPPRGQTGVIPYPRPPAGAGRHPQILLRRRFVLESSLDNLAGFPEWQRLSGKNWRRFSRSRSLPSTAPE